MKRLIALLAASAFVASVGMVTSSPASAQTYTACAGTGTAELSNTTGLGFPPATSTPPNSADGNGAEFEFEFTAGVCASSDATTNALAANGSLTGYCGWSDGRGTANDEDFTYTSRGTIFLLTGEINGAASDAEDPTDIPSCRTNDARNFLISGLASYES